MFIEIMQSNSEPKNWKILFHGFAWSHASNNERECSLKISEFEILNLFVPINEVVFLKVTRTYVERMCKNVGKCGRDTITSFNSNICR